MKPKNVRGCAKVSMAHACVYICAWIYACIYTYFFCKRIAGREICAHTNFDHGSWGASDSDSQINSHAVFSATFTAVTYFYPCQLINQVSDLACQFYTGGNSEACLKPQNRMGKDKTRSLHSVTFASVFNSTSFLL